MQTKEWNLKGSRCDRYLQRAELDSILNDISEGITHRAGLEGTNSPEHRKGASNGDGPSNTRTNSPSGNSENMPKSKNYKRVPDQGSVARRDLDEEVAHPEDQEMVTQATTHPLRNGQWVVSIGAERPKNDRNAPRRGESAHMLRIAGALSLFVLDLPERIPLTNGEPRWGRWSVI